MVRQDDRTRLDRRRRPRFLRAIGYGVTVLAAGVLAMAAVGAAAEDAISDTGNGQSLFGGVFGAVSAEGRYIVFVSRASDLVAGQVDTNNVEDVFLYDRVTGTTTLVSHVPGAPGTAGNNRSINSPVISADGAFVAFSSYATNLVAGTDAHDDGDVFLYERATGIVTLVSHVPGDPTTTGNNLSYVPVISADGAFVAFVSSATDLVAGTDAAIGHNVFLYERATDTVTLVSHVPGAPGTPGNRGSFWPVMSADGAFVGFVSYATDLVPGTDPNSHEDTPNGLDVFLYERATGTVTLVSHVPGSPTTTGNFFSDRPAISTDGAFVTFVSEARDLVPGTDANWSVDVFLYERATGTVTLVSHVPGSPTTTGNSGSGDPVISADGAFVLFQSSGAVFLYERATSTMTLVSHVPGAPGTPGNRPSFWAGMSADAEFVAFTSTATNLVATTDANGNGNDVFLWERATGTVTLVSHAVGAPATTGNGASSGGGVSADGAVVVLVSLATNLVAGTDGNGTYDVFVYERAIAMNTLVSRRGLPDGPDLRAISVSNPPATSLPGGRFTVSDKVLNQGNAGARLSITRYYLSLVLGKTGESTLLMGMRTVDSLEAGASSEGSKIVTVPVSTAFATYYLLACADDVARVMEIDESNNCAVAATQVTVGRPDLVVTAVSDPPGAAAPGSSFSVMETVTNQSALGAGPSTTRYYISLNAQREAGDRLLMGSRAVSALDADESFPATPVTVTIPKSIPAGAYFLVACADDIRRVMEGSETNNCRASATTVVVP